MREARWPVFKTVGLSIVVAALGLGTWVYTPDSLPKTIPSAVGIAVVSAVLFLLLGRAISLGRAWLVLGTIATPTLVLTPILQLPGWFFLIPAVVLAGFYSNGVSERVPLYLSNTRTKRAIVDLVPEGKDVTMIDLGCGLGGVVEAVARVRPHAVVIGVETAPLSFVIAWLRIKLFSPANAEIRFQSIWETDVSRADTVYAFLSPAPMTRLNEKLRAEMKPGSLFVSNSFAVPGQEPHTTVQLDDTRQTQLLIWKM